VLRARSLLSRSVLVLSLGLVLGLSGLAPAVSPDLRLSPERVEVGTFFEGAEVQVTGEMPAGAVAVVEVRGSAATEKLLRKGRRGGLWMSVGEIQVHHAPSLYFLMSSSPEIPSLTGGETPWGLEALAQRVKFTGRLEAGEMPRFFQEFLELKKSEGLYQVMPGALRVSPPREGRCAIHGAFLLPAKVPPGSYAVRLTVLQEGRELTQKNSDLAVRVVGFPAMLATLAYQHGALYGTVAVVIAIVTGFLMGFLFKGKAEH
jgi:uncharacterized protein (TIGR02186 family)